MSDKQETGGEVVTEDQLLKSLTKLEGKAQEEQPKKEPTVETPKVETTAEALAKSAGSELKKSLEVSGVLREFAQAMGAHTDNALAVLQKSVSAGAARDLAVLGVLEKLTKSVETLTAKVEAFGNQPAGGVKSAITEQPLEKGLKTGGEDKTGQTEKDIKKQVKVGLETLVKSLKPGEAGQAEIVHAAIKFETTGQIDDAIAARAIGAYKRTIGGG